LAHVCGHEPEDEKLPWRVSRGVEARPKTSQHNDSVTLMENETDKQTMLPAVPMFSRSLPSKSKLICMDRRDIARGYLRSISKQDRIVSVKQPEMIQHTATGKYLAHITARNAPTNNPYNTLRNIQKKMRMVS